MALSHLGYQAFLPLMCLLVGVLQLLYVCNSAQVCLVLFVRRSISAGSESRPRPATSPATSTAPTARGSVHRPPPTTAKTTTTTRTTSTTSHQGSQGCESLITSLRTSFSKSGFPVLFLRQSQLWPPKSPLLAPHSGLSSTLPEIQIFF